MIEKFKTIKIKNSKKVPYILMGLYLIIALLFSGVPFFAIGLIAGIMAAVAIIFENEPYTKTPILFKLTVGFGFIAGAILVGIDIQNAKLRDELNAAHLKCQQLSIEKKSLVVKFEKSDFMENGYLCTIENKNINNSKRKYLVKKDLFVEIH